MFFPFQVIGSKTPFEITYEKIISAMTEISKSGNATRGGRKYAVMNPQTGDTFAPKDILRTIIKHELKGKSPLFYGGKGPNGANRPFQAFGFPVGSREYLLKARKSLKHWDGEILSTDVFLDRLFQKKWRELPKVPELKEILKKDGKYPGVYLLAYSEEELSGKVIKEDEVFYVGMTCEAGLRKRLIQFRQAVGKGGFHSGGDRFFKLWLKGKEYPQGNAKLYFAYLPFECENEKEWRSPEDVAILSRVPELEFAVIGHIKRTLGHEPLLNKK